MMLNMLKIKQAKDVENLSRIPQTFMQAATAFEQSRIDEMKRSRKMAWMIAALATALCTISIIASLVALLFRKEPEPVVLRVDNATGSITSLQSIRDSKILLTEEVKKHYLAQYVRACERYDWYDISQDSATCALMSDSDVAKEQANRVRSPNAPLNLLKDKGRVAAKVNSIVFLGETAQIRFTTEKLNNSGENTDNSPVQKWIATVAYDFKPGNMSDQELMINPTGFKAVSYRVDPEVVK